MTRNVKYSTLKELKAAYDSGELSLNIPLVLDNDHAFVYVNDELVYRTDEPPKSKNSSIGFMKAWPRND